MEEVRLYTEKGVAVYSKSVNVATLCIASRQK